MLSPDRLRLRPLTRLFGALALIVAARLFWVQVAARERYLNPTNIAYHKTTILPAEKGALLDRNDRVLARCVAMAAVTANPRRVRRPRAVAKALAATLDLPESELLANLERVWRRVQLRRDVPEEVLGALRPLADQGILTFSKAPGAQTYSVYVYPRQFQPGPSDRARLAVELGLRAAEIDRCLSSQDPVVRCHEQLSDTGAKRLEQLALPGLVVQANPPRMASAVWLEPSAAAMEEVTAETSAEPKAKTGAEAEAEPEALRRAALAARLRPGVWEALAPLWQGVERPPARGDVEARLRAPFVYLARQLPTALGEAVRLKVAAEDLSGVEVLREYGREYPQGDVARLLLGRCDVDLRGITGLELQYNQILTGVDGSRKVTVNPQGRPIVQEREQRTPPTHGKSLELTLDAVIQGYAEEAVAGAVEEFDGDWGLAVVADPTTGELLALADYVSARHDQPAMIRGLATAYEPGSVLKPVVVAAAVEESVVSDADTFGCSGTMPVGGRTLRCIKVHGTETVSDAVRDSCNMALIQIGARLGQPKLEPYFRRFGLLGRTGVAPASMEASGNIFVGNSEGRWGTQKLATVAYGKGIATTAVGIVRAYSAIINGGTLPNLHLVRRILDREGRVVVEQPTEPGPRVLAGKTCAKVRAMLHAVVNDPEGTGRIAGSTLYDFGGKTGTSVAYSSEDRRVVSFIGFGPYDRARLVTLVSVCEPRLGMRWGGSTCGAAYRAIMEKSLQYLGVPPKEGATNPPPPKPPVSEEPVGDAKKGGAE